MRSPLSSLPRWSSTILLSTLSTVVSAMVLAVSLSTPLPGQNVWSRTCGTAPAARDRHAMAYDAVRGRIVLFGGTDAGESVLGDTWEWDGTSWTQAATTGPPPRADHAMAFDSWRGRVVLFGGSDAGSNPLGDTWEWDGTTWTGTATTGPAPRSAHAMAFDTLRGHVLLLGGADTTTRFGDTWTWDGAAWTRVATTGPAARSAHAMAFDTLRGQCVMFGGKDSAALRGDTWVWNGSSWAQAASTGPAPRRNHGMVFDTHRGRVVLFGGVRGGGLGDTWEWDASSWGQVGTAGPTPRASHAMAHDAQRRRVAVFGGRNGALVYGDTWTLACAPWCDLGHATPGTHGSPRLAGQGTLEGGTTMTLTLSNALARSTAFLVTGVSPIHVPFLGGTVVPNPLLVLPITTPGTAGSPTSVTLGPFGFPAGTTGGTTLYFQSWIVDPAGPFGLAASNGIVGTTRRSLYGPMSESFDALLRGAAPPASSLKIYSVQDFTNLIFVRNTACWAAPIDLTGLSPWNRAAANKRAGTLVSPRHVVFARHFALSTATGNNDIVFVTQQNVTVTRKVVAVTFPASDIGVGLLDADVPPSINFHKVLPQDWTSHLPRTLNLPMLHLDQEEKALVRNMGNLSSCSTLCTHRGPTDPLRAPFSETLIGGDSGNPAFVLVDGEAVLILTHWTAVSGPFYTFHQAAVNAAMTQLGGGYQLTEVDLSAVPR